MLILVETDISWWKWWSRSGWLLAKIHHFHIFSLYIKCTQFCLNSGNVFKKSCYNFPFLTSSFYKFYFYILLNSHLIHDIIFFLIISTSVRKKCFYLIILETMHFFVCLFFVINIFWEYFRYENHLKICKS